MYEYMSRRQEGLFQNIWAYAAFGKIPECRVLRKQQKFWGKQFSYEPNEAAKVENIPGREKLLIIIMQPIIYFFGFLFLSSSRIETHNIAGDILEQEWLKSGNRMIMVKMESTCLFIAQIYIPPFHSGVQDNTHIIPCVSKIPMWQDGLRLKFSWSTVWITFVLVQLLNHCTRLFLNFEVYCICLFIIQLYINYSF